MLTQVINKEELKKLYDKDFVLWVEENLKLLKDKQFDLVDWEHLLEEIEDMGNRHLDSVVSFMAVILEHLYKWENFRENEKMGNSWIRSINNGRIEILRLFDRYPSLRAKSYNEIEYAWKDAVRRLVKWFEDPENIPLAKKYFGRLPTEKDFPEKCPYTFEQILNYKPWLKGLEDYEG
ncbi:MAG: DUF29 domain-containing protein [Sulfurihydrogenibium sp.]|jgi:hypothetical protein|nr:DUF29 domain-containing protein [Sulfurihydrogenibium sp.]